PNPQDKQEKPAPTPQQQELDRLFEEGKKAAMAADFPAAEKAFLAGLEKAQALKDERRTARFLNLLGFVYNNLGQLDKALDYHTRALATREKLGNPQDIAASLN